MTGTVKSLFTQEDDTTPEFSAYVVAMCLVMLCIFQAATLATFSAMGFGGGCAAILTAGGAALLMRRKGDKEPPADRPRADAPK